MTFQVQASDEILRIVCFAAVKGSNREKKKVLMAFGPEVLSGYSANTPYWHVDKLRPAAVHRTDARLSGNGYSYEKSLDPRKWLKRNSIIHKVRVSWLLGVHTELCKNEIKYRVFILERKKREGLQQHIWCEDLVYVWTVVHSGMDNAQQYSKSTTNYIRN